MFETHKNKYLLTLKTPSGSTSLTSRVVWALVGIDLPKELAAKPGLVDQ